MANLESLNVQIVGDVKGLTNSIAKAEKSLLAFDATAAKSSSSVSKSLAATATAANKVDSSLANYSKGSNQATQATTNLSRVLQDAPFGFIGIANNLNPLLESFQRLGKESGGLGGALKALGGSLMGAGGIGLALSAFQFFALGGVDAIKKMFGALGDNKAVAEARKEMEAFNKSLKDAEAGALSTGLKLQSFVDIAKNGALPLSQRNEALKEANKILGEHGTKLTLANVATEAITKQTEMFTKALIAQAVAAKFADRIADLYVQQADARAKLLKTTLAYNKATKQSNELQPSKLKDDLATVAKFALIQRDEDVSYLTSLSLQIKTLTDNLKQATNEATKLGGKLDDGKDGKKLKTVLEVLAELKKELAGLSALSAQGLLTNFELDSKSIEAYRKAIKEIAGIDAGSVEISKLGLTVNPIVIRNLIEEMGMKIKDSNVKLDVPIEIVPIPTSNFDAALNNQGIEILRKKYTDALIKAKIFSLDGVPIDFGTTTTERLKKEYENLTKDQLTQIKALEAIVINGYIDAFSGIGNAIASGLSGGNFAASLFSGLFETLGAGLQAYGKQIIVASNLLKTLQSALEVSNFGGSLLIGIGLVALGGLTKNLAGTLKLADGGFVSGKGSSRSDSIPAMLSNGEYVINAAAVRKFGLNNLDKINSLQGFAAGGVIGVPQPYAVPNNNVSIDRGNDMVIMGETVLRGQDIYVLYNRAAKQAGRNS